MKKSIFGQYVSTGINIVQQNGKRNINQQPRKFELNMYDAVESLSSPSGYAPIHEIIIIINNMNRSNAKQQLWNKSPMHRNNNEVWCTWAKPQPQHTANFSVWNGRKNVLFRVDSALFVWKPENITNNTPSQNQNYPVTGYVMPVYCAYILWVKTFK